MSIPSSFFGFKVKAIASAAGAIILIHLAANVTIINAQQQEEQQLSTSQPTESTITRNGTTATTGLFESTTDRFRLQIPEGWVIQDLNNTGFTLAVEVTQGYGILAELCPREDGRDQQSAAVDNSSSSNSSCQQQAQRDIIYILRYPNLDSRPGVAFADISDIIPDSILDYEMQKLHEVGYRDIHIVNSTETRINIHYVPPAGLPAADASIPARLVEITYSTDSAPSEIRRGYFILTATALTSPNLGTITGYSIFYEGGSNATGVEQTTTPTGVLLLPAPLRQVFDSFELIASEEAAQIIVGAIGEEVAGNEPTDQEEGEEGEEDE
jgi:hypothetical protein